MSSDGAPQHIVLRRSVVLHAGGLAFVFCATIAFQLTFGARLGMWHALPLTVALAAFLGLALVRWTRAQPATLELCAGRLTARDASGAKLAEGSIRTCGQWSGLLLMVTLAGAGRRSHPILIAADMVGADTFRRLAVAARRGVQPSL